MSSDECEPLLRQNDNVRDSVRDGHRSRRECVVVLEPEPRPTPQYGSKESSVTAAVIHDRQGRVISGLENRSANRHGNNDPCSSASHGVGVSDLDAIQRRLLQTKRTRDLSQLLPLPEGKEAHFFISYSSEDRTQVLPIIARLEEHNRVACIFDERDFVSGMEIHENIRRGMERSVKVLVFLSRNFLHSRYCGHERTIAFAMSMREGRNLIVPVKLEACEVPSPMDTLTYIDVSAEGLTDKVIDAFNSTETDIVPFELGTSRALENGYTIRLPIVREKIKTLCCKTTKTKIVYDDMSKQMVHTGRFQVAEETIQQAVDLVNLYKAKGHWPRSPRRKMCCKYTFIGLLVSFVLMLVLGIVGMATNGFTFDTVKDASLNVLIVFLSVGPAGIAIAVNVCVCYYVRKGKADQKSIKEELFKSITSRTFKDGVIFKIHDYAAANTFPKVFTAYLADKIKQRMDERSPNLPGITPDSYANLALFLIGRTLDAYVYDASIPQAPENRHNVQGGRSCVCQVLECFVGQFVDIAIAQLSQTA